MTARPPIPNSPIALEDAASIESIESIVRRLWEDESAATEGVEAAVRVSLGNVVAIADRAASERVREALDRLSRLRPCRMVLAEIDPRRGAPGVAASMRALCHRPRGSEAPICCERIELSLAPEAAASLQGIVAALVQPDLPSVLWWDRRLRGCKRLLTRLARELGELLFDLERVGSPADADALSRTLGGVTLHDMAWMRLEPWRRELARVFDDPAMRAMLDRVRTVRVEVGGDASTVPACAVLYLGWLCAQLGWSVEAPLAGEGGRREARARGPNGEIRFEVAVTPIDRDESPRPRAIELDLGDDSRVELRREDSGWAIATRVAAGDRCPLPRASPGAALTTHEAIGAAMETGGPTDPIYLRALKRAVELAEA